MVYNRKQRRLRTEAKIKLNNAADPDIAKSELEAQQQTADQKFLQENPQYDQQTMTEMKEAVVKCFTWVQLPDTAPKAYAHVSKCLNSECRKHYRPKTA